MVRKFFRFFNLGITFLSGSFLRGEDVGVDVT